MECQTTLGFQVPEAKRSKNLTFIRIWKGFWIGLIPIKKIEKQNEIDLKQKREWSTCSHSRFLFVTLLGFKPKTSWAVIRCAIQLRHKAIFYFRTWCAILPIAIGIRHKDICGCKDSYFLLFNRIFNEKVWLFSFYSSKFFVYKVLKILTTHVVIRKTLLVPVVIHPNLCRIIQKVNFTDFKTVDF